MLGLSVHDAGARPPTSSTGRPWPTAATGPSRARWSGPSGPAPPWPRPRDRVAAGGGRRRRRPRPAPPTSWPRCARKVEDLSPAVTAQLAALGAIPTAGAQQDRNSHGAGALAGLSRPARRRRASCRRPRPRIADSADLPAGDVPRAGRGRSARPRRRLGRDRQQPGDGAARRDGRGRQHGALAARQALRRRHLGPRQLRLRWLHLRGLAAGRVRRPARRRRTSGPPARRSTWPACRSATSSSPPAARTSASTSATATSSAPPPRTYQVGVRSVVGRLLGHPRDPARPGDAERGADGGRQRTGACGAPLPAPGPVDPAWGGYSNGQIPGEALCALGVARHALRCDAAASYAAMSAAFESTFGSPLCITDSYRSYASQVVGVPRASRRWPPSRARPTTGGRWRSTCAAGSTSPGHRSGPG